MVTGLAQLLYRRLSVRLLLQEAQLLLRGFCAGGVRGSSRVIS
ncbi:MAG: hypothetical protein OXM87_06145 [Truepera sp.]|nr:hypothetical protein [Truepera sp.]